MPVLNVSNEQKLTAIRDTVAKGASDAEFTMLMHLANTYQLDPFLKEIWFIKYGTTPTIMVSRDGLRNYAQRQEDFDGLLSQEVRKGDKFSYNPITKEIHHEIGDGSGEITKAYAVVYRKGKPAHTELVDFQEYFTALSGKNGVWKSHPSAMIKKVVEVLALKKCYTITGLYAPEEMGLQEVDHIPPANTFDVSYTMGEVVEDQTTSGNNQADLKEHWIKAATELNQLAESVGVTKDDLRKIGERMIGNRDPRKWTLADINRISDYLKQPPTDGGVSDDSGKTAVDTIDLPSDDDLPF